MQEDSIAEEVSSLQEVRVNIITPSKQPSEKPSMSPDELALKIKQRENNSRIRHILVSRMFLRAHIDCERRAKNEFPPKYHNFEEFTYGAFDVTTGGNTKRKARMPKSISAAGHGIPLSHHCLVESECQWCYSCCLCGRAMCVNVYENFLGEPCHPVEGELQTMDHLLLDDQEHIWTYITKEKECKQSWKALYEDYRKDIPTGKLLDITVDEIVTLGFEAWSKYEFLSKIDRYHSEFTLDKDLYKSLRLKVEEIFK